MKILLTLLFCFLTISVQAQTRLVVPYAQGGAADQMARLIQKHLLQDINEKVLVEFAPGASTEIGMDLVANSGSNEIVLLINGPPIFTTGIKKNKLDFYQSRLQLVHHLGNVPFVLVVSKKLGVRNFAEFQALDSKRKISYGSSGVLSATHIAGASLGNATDKNLLHVPYKGSGQAIPDLIGGHNDAMVIHWNSVAQLVQSDQLVALAVDSDQRLTELSQVPTFRELGLNRINRHGWLIIFSNKTSQTKKITEIQQSLYRFTTGQDYKESGFVRESRQPTAQEFYNQGLKTYTAIIKQVEE